MKTILYMAFGIMFLVGALRGDNILACVLYALLAGAIFGSVINLILDTQALLFGLLADAIVKQLKDK